MLSVVSDPKVDIEAYHEVLVLILGLTWEETKARCPPEVVPACHNSTDNVTVSGSTDAIAKFVKSLQAEGIFAKEVKSSGVAFHSRYISEAAPKLRKYLERVSFSSVCHILKSSTSVTS
jgi:fatty acid synthase